MKLPTKRKKSWDRSSKESSREKRILKYQENLLVMLLLKTRKRLIKRSFFKRKNRP